MNDSQSFIANKGPDLRVLTHVAYGLYALGILTGGLMGVATLAAVVLLYIKRADVAGTFYAAHFDWLLRTFWWGILWLSISLLATLLFIGVIGIFATVIWLLYRLIKGWLALLEEKGPTAYA